MRLLILGSGTSFGVPVVGCDCGVCTSDDPRDRRTRTAAVIESDGGRRLLIDTPPELRLQLLREGVDHVDAVLYTHEHADHVHGIDDLRALSLRHGDLPIYAGRETASQLRTRFSYIFDAAVQPPPGTSKPQLVLGTVEPLVPTEIAGMTVVPLAVDHGSIPVLGFRVGPVAYVTDAKRLDGATIDALRGVRVLVLNGLFDRPHPTHLSIPEAIEIAQDLGPEQTFLTHLTHRHGYTELAARLPEGIAPAYDGLAVELDARSAGR